MKHVPAHSSTSLQSSSVEGQTLFGDYDNVLKTSGKSSSAGSDAQLALATVPVLVELCSAKG